MNLRALPEDESVAPGLQPSPHGCDLGSHIIYALDRKDPKTGKPAGTRGKRIAEIKSFYGWLRTEKFLLRAHEDPTFGRLKGIKSKRAQSEDYSKVIPYEHIQKVQKHWYSTPLVTNQHGANDPQGNFWKADVLQLQLATAFHYSEVRRFCDPKETMSALIVPGHPFYNPEVEKDLPGGAVVRVRAKKSGMVSVRISAKARVSAERLRAHGVIGDPHHFYHELRDACAAVKVPYFTPGRMRHTVLTWAQEHDAREDVMTFAHHFSQSTSGIYTLHAVPKKVWTRV